MTICICTHPLFCKAFRIRTNQYIFNSVRTKISVVYMITRSYRHYICIHPSHNDCSSKKLSFVKHTQTYTKSNRSEFFFCNVRVFLFSFRWRWWKLVIFARFIIYHKRYRPVFHSFSWIFFIQNHLGIHY